MNKISVSTLVRYLRNKLDTDANLQGVIVSGEISNFHRHSSGHLYFTLKDEKSSISCVMFSSRAYSLKFEPKNGDKVIVSANTSIFEVSGQLQLYVNSLKLDGLGDLYQQYEELKEKLAKEGYFNDTHKKSLDKKYPENIAVLVGDNSAAMSDIKKQFTRRWPICQVDYFPVLVQGSDASKDIINKLISVDKVGYDAIILARGGGSFEDLFCFNDESLVKTIYNLDTFIISGIGHEQDYTLTDFVADLRAPTPTATVEFITPNIEDVIDKVQNYEDILRQTITLKFAFFKERLSTYDNNKYFLNPLLIIDKAGLRLDYYNQRIISYKYKFKNISSNIDALIDKVKARTDSKLEKDKLQLKNLGNLLEAYSMNSTLKRGYSIIYRNQDIINKSSELSSGDCIDIKMYEGKIKAEVK